MSVLFNHARRYELFDDNPIHLVRQSAKRRTVPHILLVDEIRQLLDAVGPLPRILIFMDATRVFVRANRSACDGETWTSTVENPTWCDRSSMVSPAVARRSSP
jgi:hypothetical protein